jgi:hypothetical protein
VDESPYASQWPIREGNDALPPWAQHTALDLPAGGAKRAASSPVVTPKRPRLASPEYENCPSSYIRLTYLNCRDQSEHLTEEELHDHLENIAKRYRWHIDEVREEYQRVGSLEGTQIVIRSYRKAVERLKNERMNPN